MSSHNNQFIRQKLSGKITRRALLSFGCLSPLMFARLDVFADQSNLVSEGLTRAADEDGYRAWLRYERISDATILRNYQNAISSIVLDDDSETLHVARKELADGLKTILGKTIPVTKNDVIPASILVGTLKSPLIAKVISAEDLNRLGTEGFLIISTKFEDKNVTAIGSQTDLGALYGVFAFLRHLQTHQPIEQLSIEDKPKNPIRILAHGDNLDGSIDRGYAGKSLWNWSQLPDHVNERLLDYARLNASIGINGVVLTKVDADPAILDSSNLRKAAALANTFRPYGLKVYICANFAAPCKLGHLTTADPLDAQVIDWWRKKADEIYTLIPNFGGFLVKANSEGLPGPQDYGRTHVDGANMLAAALANHGGIVMWRAFVYTAGNQDPDRVKRSYLEFHPLDGKFADNVLIQIKNGPLDFMPREPFHPLFGAMPKSRLIGELQINQEYLGQATHLVYLATLWKEVLDSDTYSNGASSSVAQIIESLPQPQSGGYSATANTGDNRNWCGHHFGQANWYAYGRLAWNPHLSASEIADQWIKMTWSNSIKTVETIATIMMASHEAYVGYTMPLGLHHMVGGDHYAPMPEGEGDPRGMFHHAAADGIGYDRTRAGSDAVDQYNPPLNNIFNSAELCPEKYLLWFHHLPWDYRMKSGRTLWHELCFKYGVGVQVAQKMQKEWASLAAVVDQRRHKEVADRLDQQATDAINWSNKCLTYFSQFSKQAYRPFTIGGSSPLDRLQ